MRIDDDISSSSSDRSDDSVDPGISLGNIPPPPPLSSIVPVYLPRTTIIVNNLNMNNVMPGIIRYSMDDSQIHDNSNDWEENTLATADVKPTRVFKEPTYDQIKPVIGIPIPNANTDLTNEVMKGWITKYNYDNVPPEALMEIFKFVDIHTLSTCSLVSKNWHFATLHDALWEDSVRKLFERFNNQESDYYVIDCGRMNKKYGSPIKPPPKVKKIEDYVTIENGKIISYHTLRALNIEQGKKKLTSKLKRDRKEYWRNMQQERYDNASSLKYRYFFGFSTLVYIALFIFFCLVAVDDAIPKSVIPHWHLYSFIPLWFFFLFGIGTLFFVFYMYASSSRDCEILVLGGVILLVVFGGLSSAILSFLNVAVLPITYNYDRFSDQYTISWFIVLIPAYIFAVVMFIAQIVAVGIVVIEDWSNHATTKKRWKHAGVSFFFSSMNLLMISGIALVGISLEYPTFFPIYYPAIPALIVVLGFVTVTIRELWKDRNNQYSNDQYILSFGLVFFIALAINIIIVGLYPFLLSYSWFSSLLPLTAAYAFVCRVIYEG